MPPVADNVTVVSSQSSSRATETVEANQGAVTELGDPGEPGQQPPITLTGVGHVEVWLEALAAGSVRAGSGDGDDDAGRDPAGVGQLAGAQYAQREFEKRVVVALPTGAFVPNLDSVDLDGARCGEGIEHCAQHCRGLVGQLAGRDHSDAISGRAQPERPGPVQRGFDGLETVWVEVGQQSGRRQVQFPRSLMLRSLHKKRFGDVERRRVGVGPDTSQRSDDDLTVRLGHQPGRDRSSGAGMNRVQRLPGQSRTGTEINRPPGAGAGLTARAAGQRHQQATHRRGSRLGHRTRRCGSGQYPLIHRCQPVGLHLEVGDQANHRRRRQPAQRQREQPIDRTGQRRHRTRGGLV